MNGIFVGLGSNLGDREQAIRRALAQLGKLPGTRLRRVSSLYDTDPVGVMDQPAFLNAVAELESELEPAEILWHLMLIESRLGRRREQRWGPRTIDLDLLLHGDRIIVSDELVIPHPEMHHRGFVLLPMAELAPRLVHPTEQRTMRDLLHAWGEFDQVRFLGRFWYQDVR